MLRGNLGGLLQIKTKLYEFNLIRCDKVVGFVLMGKIQ